MKQILLMLQILLFTTLISCKKNSTYNSSEVQTFDNTSKTSALIAMSKLESKKLAYNLMDGYDKFVLWKNHLASYINGNKISDKQKVVLTDLYNQITQDFFSTSKEHITNVRDKWLAVAEKTFEHNLLREIAFNLSAVNGGVKVTTIDSGEINPNNTSGPIEDCNCNISSYFTCDSRSLCPNNVSRCKVLESGCGFLGQFSCNNTCYYF